VTNEEFLEFSFPNLRPSQTLDLEHPHVYILTDKEGKFIAVFPTLRHLAFYFGLKSGFYEPQDFLIRAWWLDNRSYFVPLDLIFKADVKPNPVLALEDVPEHFTERNLESYLVEHFWRNEFLKARGLAPERSVIAKSDFNYTDPPELIPRIGWVGEHEPRHSKYKPKK
jgi:hypothetical protein